ncbi:MAG: trypsin-like peptidase domain-containing protein [Planctomycetaceae bacterium]|nr:trypsin-like peptidase domain-containing protein [Planctomycetaceae bacterium]
MSECRNRAPEKPEYVSQKGSPLLNRVMFILMFLLFVGVTIAFTPQIAQQIAYSWNIGIEQAKAKVARQFLEDNPLTGMKQRTAFVANAVAPSVVGIHVIASKPSNEYSFMPDGRGTESTGFDIGSGVIVDTRGYIVTNEHVVRGALEIRVQLSDGRIVNGELIGQDRAMDIAVLRIDASDFQTIDWGDSQQVAVGERVLAIGNPFRLQQTITSGIISAMERHDAVQIMGGVRRAAEVFPHAYLQTDAAINPGNSGGALVDMNGKLIGICTANISTEHGGNSGIGFAIPSSMAKSVYDQIVSQGEVRRGWIGVQTEDLVWYDVQQMGQERPRGAAIVGFVPRSPARAAGLQRGDIIRRWGETDITSPLHLTHVVTLTTPGTVVPVEVFRRGENLTIDVTVGTRPVNL